MTKKLFTALVALGIALGSFGILAPAHAAVPWQEQGSISGDH